MDIANNSFHMHSARAATRRTLVKKNYPKVIGFLPFSTPLLLLYKWKDYDMNNLFSFSLVLLMIKKVQC